MTPYRLCLRRERGHLRDSPTPNPKPKTLTTIAIARRTFDADQPSRRRLTYIIDKIYERNMFPEGAIHRVKRRTVGFVLSGGLMQLIVLVIVQKLGSKSSLLYIVKEVRYHFVNFALTYFDIRSLAQL